jgi:probable O-glycosylation ligase (exosortase A-associated)
LRDVLVLLTVLMSLPLSFRRPFVGMLVFSWLAYMRPQDLCWGFAREMRFSFYAAIAMLLGFLSKEQGLRPFMKLDTRTFLMAALLLMTTVSLAFAEKLDDYVIRYYFEFAKIFLIALFTTGQVDTKERLRLILWTICLSLSLYAVKGGIVGIISGGSPILRGPGGMLEDNNDFALGMVMTLPMLWYLGIVEGSPLTRLFCRCAAVLAVITILLTHSRGGFLAAAGTVLAIAYRAGNILKAGMFLTVVITSFFAFVPQSVLDRLSTIKEGGKESSANARLMSWQIAGRMIVSNPLLGVGLRNYQHHWNRHSKGITGLEGGGNTYVSHNSYLQIWAEAGTPAFACYIILLITTFWACRKVRVLVRGRDDLTWARVYANLFEAIMVGFMIGAFFLNRGHFDLVYHDIALVSCLRWIVIQQLAAKPAVAKGAKVMTVGWQLPTVGLGRLPRWGRIT